MSETFITSKYIFIFDAYLCLPDDGIQMFFDFNFTKLWLQHKKLVNRIRKTVLMKFKLIKACYIIFLSKNKKVIIMEKQRNKILLTESTARTLAQMKTNKGLNSLAELCNSFKTYGKIPTDRA